MDSFSRALGLYKTYDDDVTLFNELGLKVPDEWPEQEEFEVGSVEVGDAKITISIIAMPAMFYRFVIENGGDGDDRYTYKLETGSGTLADYWPIAKGLAQGMLVVDRVPV